MKKHIFFIVLSFFFIKVYSQNLKGTTWLYENRTGSVNFSVEINKQIGNEIHALLCGSMYNGNRIDCDPGSNNFKGTLNKGVIAGYFKSFYGGGTGKATITVLPNGKLKWEITQRPKGDYYIPDKAILSKI